MTKALILGIGGQDGSYLAELLLSKGHEVHGMYRYTSLGNLDRIEHIRSSVVLHQGDLLDTLAVRRILKNVRPDVVYNEADQDDVRWSERIPSYSYQVTFGAVGELLRNVLEVSPNTKVFQPVSATMLGGQWPQNEESPLNPHSPYACAKAGAYHLCRMYRDKGLHVSTGIMFNHDSPRRGSGYLLQRICKETKELADNKRDKMILYNIDHLVDIGYAPEYMEAAYLIMEDDVSGDYVIGTGIAYSIKELVLHAANIAGAETHRYINIDKPSLVSTPLIACTKKIHSQTGWEPKTCAKGLISLLLKGDAGCV